MVGLIADAFGSEFVSSINIGKYMADKVEEAQKKFELPTEPTHYVDVKITNPTKDHIISVGEVAPNFGKKRDG